MRMCTYLNAVTGLSQVLADAPLDAEQKENVQDIDRAGRKVVSVLNDAMRLCRIQSGQVVETVDECNLEELFSEICAMMQPKAANKGLEFAFVYCTPIPASIQCDRSILVECLINLANNAIEATESGYVHIKVGVVDSDIDSNIRFDFVDCRGKMSLKDAKEIFRPLGGVDDKQDVSAWKGLKPAITNGLASIMAGRVLVSKNPGCGLVISLVIPTGVDMGRVKLLSREKASEVLCRQSVGDGQGEKGH